MLSKIVPSGESAASRTMPTLAYKTYFPLVVKAWSEGVIISQFVMCGVDPVSVYGEVLNNTGHSVDFVNVQTTFYIGNYIAGQSSTYPKEYSLLNGQRSVFYDTYWPQAGWTRYVNSVDYYTPQHYELKNTGYLPISDLLGGKFSSYYDYTIQGKVTNNTSQSIHSVRVMALLWAADGRLLGAMSGYTDYYTLVPGTSSGFTMNALSLCDGTVANYEVYAIGDFY